MKKFFLEIGLILLFISFIPQRVLGIIPCHMDWPTNGRNVTSQLGSKYGGPNTIRTTHQGIDIDLAIGDPVNATADGTVEKIYDSWDNDENKTTGEKAGGGYGDYIVINHGDGIVTKYCHLKDKSWGTLKVGDTVKKGEKIAEGGNTGHVKSTTGDGSHLHFEVKKDGNFQDPESWLTKTKKEEKKKKGKKGNKGKHTEIITARDPNAKYGKQGMVSAGETLEYTIEFENEGEGIAYGVYITDVLDEDLNDSSLWVGDFKRLDKDKNETPANFEYRYNQETRMITVFVDNGGEVLSKNGGKFNIRVPVRADATEGTVIENYATVYFPSVPEITPTNAIVSVIPYNTRIDYVGDTKVYQGQIPEIKVKLTTMEGNIIPYQQILFKINNEVYTSTTQVDGIARAYPEVASPGTYTINIEFGGDGFYNIPSSGEGMLQILPPPPISYFEITVPKTATTNSLFELNVTARDEQGNIATTTTQATITNTTNSISPATITLTNGRWEGLAAIAASPNGGVDTITITSGIITGIATITVYITPGQTQTITSKMGTITLLETGRLTEAFFVGIKDAKDYPTFTTTYKPSGGIGLCIDVNLTGVSENEVKGSVTLFVAVPYLEANLGKIKESTLKLYTFNEQTKIWEQVSGSWVDTPNNIVFGTLTHLSLIAPLGVISFAENNNNAFAYPNPWRKNKDERYIYFANISEGSVIRIYNIVGELIDEINVTECPQRWDISSKKIASGIYIYCITGKGKKIGKIGVIK
ncbi:MAG: M23 family metallopeptidase [bacterium]